MFHSYSFDNVFNDLNNELYARLPVWGKPRYLGVETGISSRRSSAQPCTLVPSVLYKVETSSTILNFAVNINTLPNSRELGDLNRELHMYPRKLWTSWSANM